MTTSLEFSKKYDKKRALNYFTKHTQGLRALTSWREISLARKALKIAGNPQTILDLPCGAGRFWKMLAEKPERTLLAADNSQAMLDAACQLQPAAVAKRFQCFQTSALAIDLTDNAVDHILCMRLMHHIEQSADRLTILREMHRVTRDSLTFSLWVDGNLQSKRRLQRQASKKSAKPYTNRLVIKRSDIEQEIVQAGFEIVQYLDVLPGISMWRFYIVKKR